MKRIASIVFILLLAFTFSACKKKNYPSDIPKWLKGKIDVMNNESRKKGCIYSVCRTVDEYNDGSSTFYWVAIGTASPVGYTIYNYAGQEVCIAPSSTTPCGNNGYRKNFVREIWQEG